MPTLWVTSGKIRLLLIPKSGKTASNIGCEYLVIIITNKQRRRRPRGLPWPLFLLIEKGFLNKTLEWFRWNLNFRFGGQQLINWDLFFFNGSLPASFSLFFVFSIQLTLNNVQYNFLTMKEFKPWTTGVGFNCSAN